MARPAGRLDGSVHFGVEVHAADGKQIVRDSTPTEEDFSADRVNKKSDVIKAVDCHCGCNVCISDGRSSGNMLIKAPKVSAL